MDPQIQQTIKHSSDAVVVGGGATVGVGAWIGWIESHLVIWLTIALLVYKVITAHIEYKNKKKDSK